MIGVITVPLALWSAKTPTSVAGFFSRKDAKPYNLFTCVSASLRDHFLNRNPLHHGSSVNARLALCHCERSNLLANTTNSHKIASSYLTARPVRRARNDITLFSLVGVLRTISYHIPIKARMKNLIFIILNTLQLTI